MTYEEIICRVANTLGFDKALVDRTYRTYWRAVREHITSLPLKSEMTEEEFGRLQSSVNIPSIGKLYVTFDKYQKEKNKNNRITQLKEKRYGITHQED